MGRNVVVVFGGASGIGAAVVSLLLERGYKVIVADLQYGEMQHDCRLWYHCDVTNQDQVGRVFRKASAYDDVLRGIVNTTALIPKGETEADWVSAMNVNVTAAANITRHGADTMNAFSFPPDAGHPTNVGSIVHVGSVSGLGVRPTDNIPYAVSKAALHHLVKSYAVRYPGISINAVAPSMVSTSQYMTHRKMSLEDVNAHPAYGGAHILPRIADPSEIAEAIYFLLFNRPEFMTGQVLPIASGYDLMLGPTGPYSFPEKNESNDDGSN